MPQNIEYRPKPEGISVYREGNIARISGKPEGDYIMIYPKHHWASTRVPELPQNLAGSFIETGDVDWTKRDAGRIAAEMEQRPDCGPLIKILKATGGEILYGDPVLKHGDLASLADVLLILAETRVGATLIDAAVKNAKKYKGIDRRAFLSGSLASGGAYMTAPALETAGRIAASFKEQLMGPTLEFSKFVQKIHPEIWLLLGRSRDILIAHKMEHYLKYGKANLPSSLAVFFGPAHVTMENQIVMNHDARIAQIKKLAPVLSAVFKEESISNIKRATFDGTKWTERDTIDVPELRL